MHFILENGGMEMNKAKYIDHTLLKPDSTREQIDTIIEEAKTYQFKSVCINPSHVAYAAQKLKRNGCTCMYSHRFPVRCYYDKCENFETEEAIKNGASEIDMVINIGALKDKRYDDVQKI